MNQTLELSNKENITNQYNNHHTNNKTSKNNQEQNGNLTQSKSLYTHGPSRASRVTLQQQQPNKHYDMEPLGGVLASLSLHPKTIATSTHITTCPYTPTKTPTNPFTKETFTNDDDNDSPCSLNSSDTSRSSTSCSNNNSNSSSSYSSCRSESQETQSIQSSYYNNSKFVMKKSDTEEPIQVACTTLSPFAQAAASSTSITPKTIKSILSSTKDKKNKKRKSNVTFLMSPSPTTNTRPPSETTLSYSTSLLPTRQIAFTTISSLHRLPFASPLTFQSPSSIHSHKLMKKKKKLKRLNTSTVPSLLSSKSVISPISLLTSTSSSLTNTPMKINNDCSTTGCARSSSSSSSSVDISIYKAKKKKKRMDYINDNDSEYDEEEDDDESYHESDINNDKDDESTCSDYSGHDDDDDIASSFIIEEPYIPYGKELDELDSIGKEFVRKELLVDHMSDDESSFENEAKEYLQSPEAHAAGVSYDSETETEEDEDDDKVQVEVLDSSLEDEDMTAEAHIIAPNSHKKDADSSSDSDHYFDDIKSPTSSINKESIPRTNLKLKNNSSTVELGKWSLGSRIGEGSFGVVYVGMNHITGKLMAVKSLHIPVAQASSALSAKANIMEDFQREIDLMQSCQHTNIVRYIGSEVNNVKNTIHIFQEWVTGGSITSLLKKFGSFPMSVVKSYLHQIVCGLEYLHSKRILHRDIKGGNILVNDEGIVKLADFGASKKIHVSKNGTLIDMNDLMEKMTVTGTPYYMAPEVFEATFSVKSDIWSAGCVAYQMLTGQPPWKEMNLKSPTSLFLHFQKTVGPPSLKTVRSSSSATSKLLFVENRFETLLEKCFERDASRRPTSRALLKDPFFDIESKSSDECTLIGMSKKSPNKKGELLLSTSELSEFDKEIITSEEEDLDIKDWPEWAKLGKKTENSKFVGNPYS